MLYRVSSASCDASKYWRGVRDTNHLNRRSYQLKTLHSQTILPRCLLSICKSCKLLANMNINEVKFQELSWRFLPARAFRFGILGSWALANKEKFICCYEWWTFCFVKIENGFLELLGIFFFGGVMTLRNYVKGWMSYNNYSHREKCTNFAHFLNTCKNLGYFAEIFLGKLLF